MKRNGFSLVELSIVLVIIGLLVGGLMAGSSLIRSSEVKTVMTEYNQYIEATRNFRIKYAALPGDLPDASNYWATATNGDGDTRIEWATGAGASGAGLAEEAFQFWSHLVLAGLIDGTFTGTAGTVSGSHVILGTNAPQATLTKAGFSAFWIGDWVGNANNYAYNYGNVFGLGGNSGIDWAYSAVLKPEEAWNIDSKIDDGAPGAGRIISTNITNCATATSSTDYAATYRLNDSGTICGFYFVRIEG